MLRLIHVRICTIHLLQREASIDYGEVGFAALGHSGRIIVEAAVIISQVGSLTSGSSERGRVDVKYYICARTYVCS